MESIDLRQVTNRALETDPSGTVPVVDREDLDDRWPWREHRKAVLTRAVRVEGPFYVQTSEGMLRCADGYLAVDARGYPYPIAEEEFELIYEPAADAEAEATIGKTLLDVIERVREARDNAGAYDGGPGGTPATAPLAGREFSLAITALEDALMRYTRGRAQQLGVFRPVDLDDLDAERAKQERLAMLKDASDPL
jgi:hypothetical protein